MAELTHEGERLVKAWLDAEEEKRIRQAELNSASAAFSNAENDLAKWLKPEDAKVGEKFCVWYGNGLIEATVEAGGVSIRWRKRSTKP